MTTEQDATPDDDTAIDYAAHEASRRQDRWYCCYVTPGNVDHIAERFINLTRTGRRMTLVEHIGESTRSYRTEVGLTVDTRAWHPIDHRPGRAVTVNLARDGHGLFGFGVGADPMWPTLEAIHAEQTRLRAYRDREGQEQPSTWRMLDPLMPHVTYVEITGGNDPDCGETSDDRIVITYINGDRVTITREVRFDSDPLRHSPQPPYRAGYDEDGADAAWYAAQAAPPQTRWALLRDLCDRHPDAIGPAVWGELADLDAEVRPWMHTTEEG